METTINLSVPYKKRVLGDGTVEVTLPALQYGVFLTKFFMFLAVFGVGGGILYLVDKFDSAFRLGGWLILPALIPAIYAPVTIWRKLLNGKRIFYIVPKKGIRIDGKQVAFSDIDHGQVGIESSYVGEHAKHMIVARISGIRVELMGFLNHDMAMAVAHLINENGHRSTGKRMIV
ncbi:hypothetical protein ACU4GI_11555 [Cupriavidus basilensis]